MIKRKPVTLVIWLNLFIFIFICFNMNAIAQVEPGKDDSLIENKEKQMIAFPGNIQEATGIYVFLGWIWISIFILTSWW